MKDAEELKREDARYVWHHVMQMRDIAERGPKIIERGDGALVWDVDGKEYIDGMSGIYTTPIGHNRKEIRDAIYAQAEKLEFYPNFQYFSNVPVVQLAKKLSAITPGNLSVFFFVSGGSEAVDTAFKMARQYHYESGYQKRYKIIALRGGFHGVTFGGLSATGITSYRKKYEPLVPGFRHVPAPFCYRCAFDESYPECGLKCVKALEQQIIFEDPETVAAFIAEPVINPIGEVVPPKEYLPMVREICDQYGVLMILDEVITAFGRTGKMFGCQHWGVVPDIMTLAKGMASGYQPIGATVTKPEIAGKFYGEDGTELMHGHTFGGHPLACVAAMANIEIIEREDLVERGAKTSEYLFSRLHRLYDHRTVGDIRGKGMLVGIDLVKDKQTKEKYPLTDKVGIRIRERAYELGLICRDQRDVLVIAPPLILTKDQADRIADIFDQAIGDIEKEL
jgi:adenosylmethionine-8-amino-7-oxononanoate aminotransferase